MIALQQKRKRLASVVVSGEGKLTCLSPAQERTAETSPGVDDRAAPPFLHVGHCQLDAAENGHQVDVQHLPELLLGRVHHRLDALQKKGRENKFYAAGFDANGSV
jgi:hypothetical protein